MKGEKSRERNISKITFNSSDLLILNANIYQKERKHCHQLPAEKQWVSLFPLTACPSNNMTSHWQIFAESKRNATFDV